MQDLEAASRNEVPRGPPADVDLGFRIPPPLQQPQAHAQRDEQEEVDLAARRQAAETLADSLIAEEAGNRNTKGSRAASTATKGTKNKAGRRKAGR